MRIETISRPRELALIGPGSNRGAMLCIEYKACLEATTCCALVAWTSDNDSFMQASIPVEASVVLFVIDPCSHGQTWLPEQITQVTLEAHKVCSCNQSMIEDLGYSSRIRSSCRSLLRKFQEKEALIFSKTILLGRGSRLIYSYLFAWVCYKLSTYPLYYQSQLRDLSMD